MVEYVLERFKEVKKKNTTKALIDFQKDNKYLFMAYNQVNQKVLGRLIANKDKLTLEKILNQYERILLRTLNTPPQRGHMINMLQHIYGYFKDDINATDKELFLRQLDKYKQRETTIFPVLTLLKEWTEIYNKEYLKEQTIFQLFEEDKEAFLRLRLLKYEEFQQVVEWNKGKDADFLYQWAGRGYKTPLTLEQYRKRLEKGINQPGSETYVYAIESIEAGELIGTVELTNVDRGKQVATIGRFLIGSASQRGKGYGEEALRALVGIAYTVFGLKTLFLRVFDFNTSGIKCYRKVGFKEVKLEKNVYESKKGPWHCFTMVLKEED